MATLFLSFSQQDKSKAGTAVRSNDEVIAVQARQKLVQRCIAIEAKAKEGRPCCKERRSSIASAHANNTRIASTYTDRIKIMKHNELTYSSMAEYRKYRKYRKAKLSLSRQEKKKAVKANMFVSVENVKEIL